MPEIGFDITGRLAGRYIISSYSRHADLWAQVTGTAVASRTYPAANTIYYCPIRLDAPFYCQTLWALNGATATGNFDIGLYSLDGTKLFSSTGGMTAQSGTNVIQTLAMTAQWVDAGKYYLAICCDSGASTFFGSAFGQQHLQAAGWAQESGSTLPSAATFATMTTTANVFWGITARSIV